MTKEQLAENLIWLQSRKEREDRADKALDELSVDFHGGISTAFTEWESKFVDLLQVAMNDEGNDSWISYWIYECDFGRKHEIADSVRDADGKHIPLRTIDDLYNLLTNPI